MLMMQLAHSADRPAEADFRIKAKDITLRECDHSVLPGSRRIDAEVLNQRGSGIVPDYPDRGVQLHRFNAGDGLGVVRSRAYWGHSVGSSHGGLRGSKRNPAVELQAGIRGLHISEWPSHQTGLTLSGEQSSSMLHRADHRQTGNCVCGSIVPISAASYGVRGKKQHFNIPEDVW